MAESKVRYICPKCGSQLERFNYCQHTWYTKLTRMGRLTKQTRKENNGGTGSNGFSCTNCSFRRTDEELKDNETYLYLYDLLSHLDNRK